MNQGEQLYAVQYRHANVQHHQINRILLQNASAWSAVEAR